MKRPMPPIAGLLLGAWLGVCPAGAQDAGVATVPVRDAAVAVDVADADTQDTGAPRPGLPDGGSPEASGPPADPEAPPQAERMRGLVETSARGSPTGDLPPAGPQQAPEPGGTQGHPEAPTSAPSRAAPQAPEPPHPARSEAPPGERDEGDRWPSFIPPPTAATDDGTADARELVHELIPVLPATRAGSTFGLAVAILLAALGASLTRRAREVLPTRGVVPRLLQAIHAAFRLLVIGLAVALLVGLVPPWMDPALPWVLLAAAAALGWSARDLLPDLVAGIVVLFERRIRRGVWLSGEDFSGTVSGIGLRATWLVDPRGHRIAVPNRRLLSAPIVTDRAVGAEHEATVRMGAPWPAPRVRQALVDAVLQSPWVPPDTAPVVLRDPDDPHLWRVRSRLLEARYAPFFEGDLLERTEEVLTSKPTSTFPLDDELDDA